MLLDWRIEGGSRKKERGREIINKAIKNTTVTLSLKTILFKASIFNSFAYEKASKSIL